MRFLCFLIIFPSLTSFASNDPSLLELFYRLNAEERWLAIKNPLKMNSVLDLAGTALDYCLAVHGIEGEGEPVYCISHKPCIHERTSTGDASDACRHFVWAALLYREFGPSFSQQVLDAHEQTEDQSEEEKRMDLANNQIGLMAAEKLAENKQLSIINILQSYNYHRKFEKLVIIKEQSDWNAENKWGGDKFSPPNFPP